MGMVVVVVVVVVILARTLSNWRMLFNMLCHMSSE